MFGEVSGATLKRRRVLRQIAVEVPANPDVTKLKSGCDAATHSQENLALYLCGVKAMINPFLAQLYSVLLGLLFTLIQRALDSMNLNQRSELVSLINNTN